MLIVGVAIALPTLYGVCSNFSFRNVMSNVVAILIISILIIGGAIRILKRN
jgi:hypothetical protein